MDNTVAARADLSQFPIGSKWRVRLESSPPATASAYQCYDGLVGEVVGYNEELPGIISVESIVYPIRLRFHEPGLPASEQSFAPFQLEPVWRKEVRDYVIERQAAHQRHELTEPYHRVIERIAQNYDVDVEVVQSYFFQEFEKTPEYQILRRQGEVHG